MTLLVYHRVIVDHSTPQVESYLDKCIEWFQKALRHFAKQDAAMALVGFCNGNVSDFTKEN